MSTGERRLRRRLTLVLTLAAVAAGVVAVVAERHQVADAVGQIRPVSLVAALVLAVAGNGAMMLSWRALLAGFGSPLPLPAASRVFFQSQLGKYLPGSIWPLLAQVELGRKHRVPARRSAVVAMLNLGLSTVGGLVVAAVTLPLMGAEAVRTYWWSFALVPVMLALLAPRVLNPLLARAFRLVRREPPGEPITLRAEATSLGWIVAAWLFYGLHVWLVMRDLGASQARALPVAVGAFALAWAVGFLVVVAPAGAGVREAALTLGLAPVLSSGAALALAIVSRILMTAADLSLAGVAVLVAGRSSHDAPDPTADGSRPGETERV